MKKIYYLKSCDTCKKILKMVPNLNSFELQEIKTDPITSIQLEEMKELAGNYESLFNKRAQLYKSRDLKNQILTEADYKKLILEHYTFLCRPVFLINDNIYIGNSNKTIENIEKALS